MPNGEWIKEKVSRKKIDYYGDSWDSFARKDWQFVVDEYKHHIGDFISRRLGKGKKVMDLASGSWQYVPTHTAVDGSREMLLRNPAPNRLWFNLDTLADGEKLPLKNKFDAATFCFGYNYVKDPVSVFLEAKRLLKPRGRIFVAGGVSGGYQSFSLRKFDADKIKSELESIGLDVVVHNIAVHHPFSPLEFKVIEASRLIPNKRKLVSENVSRVVSAFKTFEDTARSDYDNLLKARTEKLTNLVSQKDLDSAKELDVIRKFGANLEKKFGAKVFIVPDSPLEKGFELKHVRSGGLRVILLGGKFDSVYSSKILHNEIVKEASKSLKDFYVGTYCIESVKDLADHLNSEFKRVGKIDHVFFMSGQPFLYPSFYGDIENLRKQIFEKTNIPKNVIEKGIKRGLWNDSLTVKTIHSNLQNGRKLVKHVQEKGYV